MDEAVTSFKCRKIQTTNTYNYKTNFNTTMHTFRCFEKDPIWGAVTLAIISFGSLMFCLLLKPKIDGFENCIWKLIQNFGFFLFFPFIFLFVKFVTILSGEKDKWKSASMAMTQVEGVFECGFQFMLQLFIVFKRSDREPSIIQILTLMSSFLSIINAKIEGAFASNPRISFQTKAFYLVHSGRLLLLGVLLYTFYFYVTCALLITTIQWNMIFVLLLILLNGWKVINTQKKFKIFFHRIGFFLLLSGSQTIVAILVNTYEDAIIWNLWATSITLSELAIVKRKKYFNIITGLCISCGLISLALDYFCLQEVEEDDNIDNDQKNEEIHSLKSDQS